MIPFSGSAWDVFGLSQARFETLILVFVRVASMLALVPIFSAKQIPQIARTALALLIAFLVANTIPALTSPLSLGQLAVAVAAQIFVGLAFGFVAFLVFTGIQFAGEIIDIQIGFAVVNIINPVTQQNITVIGELQLALATLIYLSVDAHHRILEGVGGSFALVALPYISPDLVTERDLTSFLARALALVFQIAAPISISLFVVNVGLGLMARVAPQMNVFVVGFPIQITVGLLMMILGLPLFGIVLPQVFAETPQQLDILLRHLAGSTPSPGPVVSPSALPVIR